MAEKTTQHQLEQLARMIGDELLWLGMAPEGSRLGIEKGSKVNGNPYRLYQVSLGGAVSVPLYLRNSGAIGLTRSEAYVALRFLLQGLEAVRWSIGDRLENPFNVPLMAPRFIGAD